MAPLPLETPPPEPQPLEIPTPRAATSAKPTRSRRNGSRPDVAPEDFSRQPDEDTAPDAPANDDPTDDEAERRRRRRGRRGRGRGRTDSTDIDSDTVETSGDRANSRSGETDPAEESGDNTENTENFDSDSGDSDSDDEVTSTRRRRRRRSRGSNSGSGTTDATSPEISRDAASKDAASRDSTYRDDEVQGVRGSARLEAKRQRRRDGRENRRRAPVVTEAEFLARRESVDRVMAVRQRKDLTQVAVLEDDVLVEHYVTRASSSSLIGGVYLGKVQNVLPSMEAAFVDIGRGRNAILYAGEVNWDSASMEGKPRKIEQALRPGDSVMVQVTKDPVGHKGARLTSQISLPGRFLVYVPGGEMTGISRKLPDTERRRLKDILKEVVPEQAGVIIRTAAEGASEPELTRDVARLAAQWEAISAKAKKASAPTQLYDEPDLVIRVIRDIFNEDFAKLLVQGDDSTLDSWDLVEQYVSHVSPDLADRLTHYSSEKDLFAELRIDEQLAKALERKVWLPSGGSLVIDRTEAMTVVDVNTGKFTGQGGNLEETVTRNNLEAAEEVVRQLRLRDIGGIVVVDFIDMVLEGNRDLVLRRLTECLGRDRTRHQVSEVTSLGLVQMTRKRLSQGLLEAYSESCEHCKGRGVVVHSEPLPERAPSGRSGGASRAHDSHAPGRDIVDGAAPESPAPGGPAGELKQRRRSRRSSRRPAGPPEAQVEVPTEVS
ncbi:MAG: Rne/Rng family ribonuclease, partial [Mycobacteriales bacterium]